MRDGFTLLPEEGPASSTLSGLSEIGRAKLAKTLLVVDSSVLISKLRRGEIEKEKIAECEI